MIYIILLIGLLFFLDLRRRNKSKKKIKIIDNEIAKRHESDYNWDDFNSHFTDKGNSKEQILAVKSVLQDYSRIAQTIIFPTDHLFNDLLITSYNNELGEIINELNDRLNVKIDKAVLEETSLTVENLFKHLQSL